jgi:hypothetical protein
VAVEEGRGPRHFDMAAGDAGFAFGWEWYHRARMHARVLDIAHGRVAGSLSASATGKSVAGLAVVIILPIPFGKPSFPVGTASRELGEGVAKFLAGEDPPNP